MTNHNLNYISKNLIENLRYNLRVLAKLHMLELDSNRSGKNQKILQIYEQMHSLANIINKISILYGGF